MIVRQEEDTFDILAPKKTTVEARALHEAAHNDTLYEASPFQQEVHALTHNEVLVGGAAGAGKTVLLKFYCLHQVLEEHRRCSDPSHPYPLKWGMSKGYCLFVRRTYKDLQQTIAEVKIEFRQIDPGGRWNEKELTFTFASGYQFRFGHLQDADSYLNYYGLNLTLLLCDEVTQIDENSYTQLDSRVRSADPVLRLSVQTISATNPVPGRNLKGDPNWVRKRFIIPCIQGRKTIVTEVKLKDGSTGRSTRIFIPATLLDNPNPQFRRDYEIKLAGKPAHIRRALLDGDWFVVAHGYFAESWDPAMHVVRPFRIPHTWKVFRAMDWGFKEPGVVLYCAMDEEGNVFVTYEHNFRGKDARVVGEELVEYEKKSGLWAHGKSRVCGPADTQLWEKRGDVGQDKATEMRLLGIGWVKADKRSRARNAQRIITRLKDMDGGEPGLSVFNTCTNLIRTLPATGTDPVDPEAPLDGGEDHWLDTLSYACAFASFGRQGIHVRPKETKKSRIEWASDKPETDSTPRGRWGYGQH